MYTLSFESQSKHPPKPIPNNSSPHPADPQTWILIFWVTIWRPDGIAEAQQALAQSNALLGEISGAQVFQLASNANGGA